MFGRGEAKLGVAAAASEGSIADADLLVRPLLRVAELLEAVPGLIAAQHSGSGKAIAREDFRKGPYRADGGDFALAGAAYMTTIDGYARPWLSAEGGSYGYRRVAAGGTVADAGSGADIAYAYESYLSAFDRDGPVEGRLSPGDGAEDLALGAKVNF